MYRNDVIMAINMWMFLNFVSVLYCRLSRETIKYKIWELQTWSRHYCTKRNKKYFNIHYCETKKFWKCFWKHVLLHSFISLSQSVHSSIWMFPHFFVSRLGMFAQAKSLPRETFRVKPVPFSSRAEPSQVSITLVVGRGTRTPVTA